MRTDVTYRVTCIAPNEVFDGDWDIRKPSTTVLLDQGGTPCGESLDLGYHCDDCHWGNVELTKKEDILE